VPSCAVPLIAYFRATDDLATAGDDRLDGVAREWAGTDGLAGVDAAVLRQALRLFAALAKRAIDMDGHLYCWWAL
jgi:hypothetical protein